ncbi:MAG: hypothetical protein ACFFFT_00950 [Candidatus Thorarchaeota archaeon]
MSEARVGEIEVVRSKSSELILQVAGGAIFGALSTVMAITLKPIIDATRIANWGIAMFDPVSWVWIICFLVFGPYAGFISCVTGSFGLLLIDPSGWIGPLFKFCATIPLIIIPYLILKLWERDTINSKKLKNPKYYVITGGLSIVFRIIVMIFMNYLFFITYWGLENLDYATLPPFFEIFGLKEITGKTAVLIFTPVINLYAGVLDLAIPYFLVFGPKLDEKFGFW